MKKTFRDIKTIKLSNVKIIVFKENHRKQLIRWLVDVIGDLKYSFYTLLRTINLLDMYKVHLTESTSEFQLVTITCLFIVAKFEESQTHYVQYYEYLSGCKREPIFAKEKKILKAIKYKIYNEIPSDHFKESHLEKIDAENSIKVKELLNKIILSFYENKKNYSSDFEIYAKALKLTEKIYKGEIQIENLSESVKYYLKDIKLK